MASPKPYFPPDSLIRRVVGERVVGLTYGARASFVGALHPVAMEGTSQSTAAKGRPFQRLGHTAKAFNALIFGTTEEAQHYIDLVGRMHDKVSGELQVDGGPSFPRGTSYSAYDPEASFWTLAVLADSAEVLYRWFVRPLTPTEQEDYWRDFRRFGIAFGLPADTAPDTYAEFRDRYEGILHSGRLHLTATGYTSGMRVGFNGPMHPLLAPLTDAMYLIVVGTAPKSVRDAYGLDWTRQHAMALHTLTGSYRVGRRFIPPLLRNGSPQPLVDAIVGEERRRLRGGLPVWAPT